MLPRSPVALPSLGVVLMAAALTGADCHSNSTPTGPLNTSPAPTTVVADTGSAAPPNEGFTEAEVQKLLPGVDTAGMTPKQRSDLVDLAGDTFCPCAATTVSGCLRQGPSCPAAHRLMELAKKMILAGQPEAQALLRVEAYYGSFPDNRRVEVNTDGPSKGAENAKVTIVEFSDFQCPACRAAHPGLTELVEKYPNDVRWVFKNFPLPMHQHSTAAAAAGVYAYAHHKFWETADWFFGHQELLGDDGFKAAAKAVGLDPTAFLAATTDPKELAKVEADKTEGENLKLSGTPSIFINGRQFVSMPATIEFLTWTVEDEFEWMSNGKKWATK